MIFGRNMASNVRNPVGRPAKARENAVTRELQQSPDNSHALRRKNAVTDGVSKHRGESGGKSSAGSRTTNPLEHGVENCFPICILLFHPVLLPFSYRLFSLH